MKKINKIYSLALISALSLSSIASASTNVVPNVIPKKPVTNPVKVNNNEFNTNFKEVMDKLKVPYEKISNIVAVPEINGNYVIIDMKNRPSDDYVTKTAFLVFANGKTIMPFDIEHSVPVLNKNGIALTAVLPFEKSRIENNHASEEKTLKKVKESIVKIYNEKEDNAIVLNSGKKETMLVFTDPHCPACNSDLGKISEYMKTYNVSIILTPLALMDSNKNVIVEKSLHSKSPAASANILSEIDNAKTNDDKLKVLRKHFNTAQKLLNENPSKDSMEKVYDINQKYLKSGLVDRTPFHIIITK